MERINTFDELVESQKKFKSILSLRNNSCEKSKFVKELLVCGGTGCNSSDSNLIVENLNKAIKSLGLENKVNATLTGCFGFCAKGPIVKVFPDDVFYVKVKPEDAEEIVNEHIVKDKVIDRLLFEEPALDNKKVRKHTDMFFYKNQLRIALRNCGTINPEIIDEYIANEGYLSLGKCVSSLSRDEVVEIVERSGLRGRGGAGFPTGTKWRATKKSEGDDKYVICNADEGDPGAFMDRSILEGDPHSVLEAMAICGYAIGANTGYIYIRAEYPLAIHRLTIALNQAKERGLLGQNILGTGFNFEIELKYGAGAFVCGEGSALMNSIEGNRGEPRHKRYSSTREGLWGRPTCLNNVETLANIPIIINKGADWYRNYGTDDSSGTKVFALGGKVNNTGLVEVPMGITLREIVFNIGGGIPNNRKIKAVQTGGPSGGFIPESLIDTKVDFKNLENAGSMMGSGGMLVLDEKDCIVSIAKFFLEFTVEESCGKCTPCRIGTTRLHEILTKISEGKGTVEDLDLLYEIGVLVKETSLCGLGKGASNPVLSTLEYFYDEYLAHVKDKKCPAGQCKNLISYYITDKCIGCTKCARICPGYAITGKVKNRHVIDLEKCLKCGACLEVCNFNAIINE